MIMKNNERIPEEFRKDNPFVASKSFESLVKANAAMAKLVLRACSNSGEAVNAILSLMVTFLKNIPDELWGLMVKVANEQDDDNPTLGMIKHLDAVRSYDGKNYVSWEEEDPSNPTFTTKPPTQTQ